MKTLSELTVAERCVFLRTEFNVALDGQYRVMDDSRIRASLSTINRLCQHGARVMICSHIGRPWGERDETKSLKHIVGPLGNLLGKPISFAADCVGPARRKAQTSLAPSEILLLENVRFHGEENDNAPGFAEALAENVDVYVNDAFGNSHRPHASMVGVPHHVSQKGAGLLLDAELEAVRRFLDGTKHPSVAVVGGAKVAGKDGKIHVIRNLLRTMDAICIVGKIAYFFLQARGEPVGKTLLEDTRGIDAPDSHLGQCLQDCSAVLEEAENRGKTILLPLDSVIAWPDRSDTSQVNHDLEIDFPKDAMALDIGPRTIEAIGALVRKAESVVWNGPAGYFEDDRFRGGTLGIADAVRRTKAEALVGGGDTVTALTAVGFPSDRVHICTGGGAMLTMLMGRELPAVAALTD